MIILSLKDAQTNQFLILSTYYYLQLEFCISVCDLRVLKGILGSLRNHVVKDAIGRITCLEWSKQAHEHASFNETLD